MSEPWFNPDPRAALLVIPLMVAGILLAVIARALASRGKAKRLILGMWWLYLSVTLALLVAGVVGRATGQPYDVWFSLLMPGLLAPAPLLTLPILLRTYREAEWRRM